MAFKDIAVLTTTCVLVAASCGAAGGQQPARPKATPTPIAVVESPVTQLRRWAGPSDKLLVLRDDKGYYWGLPARWIAQVADDGVVNIRDGASVVSATIKEYQLAKDDKSLFGHALLNVWSNGSYFFVTTAGRAIQFTAFVGEVREAKANTTFRMVEITHTEDCPSGPGHDTTSRCSGK